MPDERIYCVCGANYDARLATCPGCGASNSYAAEKRGKATKVAAGVVVGIVFFMLAVAFLLPGLAIPDQENPLQRVITILQPQEARPSTVPQEELVEYALAAINKDRADFGLPPVQLSTNQAAQVHAEDVHANKQISHWLSNGEKPYMTYSRLGGSGSVHQNVAISGYSQAEYDRCVSTILLCERINPLNAIRDLQYEMMYNDFECCNDGHRDNILDPHHTHVSIGILYDDYYLAFVQNFEKDYGLQVQVENTTVSVAGPTPRAAELKQVLIYYDPLPTEAAYEEGKRMLAYGSGRLVGSVLEPLPPGFRYQQTGGHVLIEARSWESGGMLDVRFDISHAVSEPGVYTVYALFERDGQQFAATSHSIFVSSVIN